MKFQSINPYNDQEIASYTSINEGELSQMIDNSRKAYLEWRKFPIEERAKLMSQAATILRDNTLEYAKMI
ncbi:MAG: aldehyde dehydrogenase family protein, partial [Bdellovibrionales bacterium]|nr:aldehyde dehydrogenase family protein [Bdellovibrionales bacterium]